MEIGATSSLSYLPSQFAENRAAKPVVRELTGAQGNAVATDRDRKEVGNQSPALTSSGGAATSSVSDNRVAEREKQQVEETRRTQRQETPIATGGSIKLDVEEGSRVLKVFDSKDVLIYQLPPKGALMLIKAQENARQSQVQTSA